MNCPKCDEKSAVIDSRYWSYRFIMSHRRRRKCLKCEERFTTYEFHREDFMKIEENIENFRKRFYGFIKVVNESAVFLGLDDGVRLEE